ncbi:MAG: glycosyltransferase family 4 protein [Thermodesulfovibrionales bacterium]|jgi:glycosyltransferase involved in cell wall biosynthesis
MKYAMEPLYRQTRHHLGRLYRQTRQHLSQPIHVDDWIEDTYLALYDRLFPPKDKRLSILDDRFPSPPAWNLGFLTAEYNYYLDYFPTAQVVATGSIWTIVKDVGRIRSQCQGDDGFQQGLTEYFNHYPQNKGRISRYRPRRILPPGLAYTVFMDTAFQFIEHVEKSKVPFAFTLYPGGYFRLETEESDAKLRRVLTSPCFRKVIVTQKISHEYLLSKGWCAPSDIEFIYGCVIPHGGQPEQARAKRYYQQDKATFDICFVAHKYIPRGVDKGYDVFIEAAKALAKVHPDFRFHVVGSFNEQDIDVRELGDRLQFYGPQLTDFFTGFYKGMDVILSPNIHFTQARGAFDGFPTGACMEAGMAGVAVFCTDSLNQNFIFREGEEIVIIPHDASKICEEIEHYRRYYDDLYRLSRKGQEAFRRTFDIEAQMGPRVRLLSACLESGAKKEASII